MVAVSMKTFVTNRACGKVTPRVQKAQIAPRRWIRSILKNRLVLKSRTYSCKCLNGCAGLAVFCAGYKIETWWMKVGRGRFFHHEIVYKKELALRLI